MNKIFYFFSIAIILAIGSCGVKCQDPGIILIYQGYDSSDVRLIIVRRFEHNSNFSKLVQTNYSRFQVEKPYTVYKDGDTIGFSASASMPKDYDVEYELLPIGRKHRIVIEGYNQEKDSRFLATGEADNCSNTVYYNLDGKSMSGRGQSASADHPYPVYITLQK